MPNYALGEFQETASVTPAIKRLILLHRQRSVYVNFGKLLRLPRAHATVILGGIGVYCFLVPTYYIIRDVAALRDTAGC